MTVRFLLALALVLAAAPAAAPPVLRAQDAPPAAAGGDSAEPDPDAARPDAVEILAETLEVGRQADEAVAAVAALGETGELAAAAAAAAERQAETAERFREVAADPDPRAAQLGALVEEAVAQDARLEALAGSVTGRLASLTELRAEWLDRQRRWREWRASFADDPELARAFGPDIGRALEQVDRVLAEANRALPELVALERQVRAARLENRRLIEEGRERALDWRRRLFDRTAPPLWRTDLGAGIAELTTAIAAVAGREPEWRDRHLAVLALQLAVALGLALIARRLYRRVPEASPWRRVLRHPWAIGVLVSVTFLSFLYGPLSPLGRLGLGVAAAASASLVAGMFRNPRKRRAVYLVAAAYVVLLALEAIALPGPLYRLALAVLAAAGAPALAWLARANARERGPRQRGFTWALAAGALALGVVAIAEVLGFDRLAQWLLETSVVTAFVGFVTTFLLRFAAGAVRLLASPRAPERLRLLGRAGPQLAARLVSLLRVALVVAAVFYLLAVWGVVADPRLAFEDVLDAGFDLGEHRITLGGLLLAAAAVWLAMLVSALVRASLDEEFFEHRQFDRGVRDSILTLFHYVLVVIGVFLALSLLGFDLSSFVVLAGALGVGIGFGLQNIVSNFISGLILLFERPVRAGDVVVIADQWGTIQKIGLRSTVVQTFDRAEIIVPNSDLISEKVTNWTLSSRSARLTVPVGVAYGTDPTRVIELLRRVGEDHPDALPDPAPMAIFVGFGESSLDFELRVWLADIDRRLVVRTELATEIARRLAEAEIEIPFPQRDLHLRSLDPGAAERLAGPPGAADRVASPTEPRPREETDDDRSALP